MAALAGKAEVDFSKTMEIKLGQNYYDLSKETDLQQRDELSIKYDYLIFRTRDLQGLSQRWSESNSLLLLKYESWETSKHYWGLLRCGPFANLCFFSFGMTS